MTRPGKRKEAARPKRRRIAGSMAVRVAALAGLALFVFLPALRAGFIWDDDALTQNPQVRSAAGLADIWLQPGGNRFEAHYWPLVYSSFWMEYRIWGMWPVGYHLTNMALHALNGVLLFLLLSRMGVRGAWTAAAAFAVHPVHVESVAWVIERKDVLSAALYLGAFLGFVRWREVPGRWGAYALSLACFLGALLSKSIVVSFPLAVGLWVWWKEGHVSKRDWMSLLPFLGLAALVAGLDVRFARGRETADFGFSLLERVCIAGRALWFYAGKMVWPWPLMTFYPRWAMEGPPAWTWIFPLGVGAALAGLWLARRRIARGPLALVLFFCVTLGPVLGLIEFHFMGLSFVADRFQYLAGTGLIVLACAGWIRLGDRVEKRAGRKGKAGWSVAGWVLLGILAVLTFRQALLYQNDETLFRHNVAHNPGAWAAHNNLGVALEARGEFEAAMEHYQKAVEANPRFSDAHNNLGVAFGRAGKIEEAIREFREVIRLKPHGAEAHGNLGYALLRKGQAEEAMGPLEKAIELQPDFATAHLHLAMARMLEGDAAGAVKGFEGALAADPARTEAANGLAWILATWPDDSVRNGRRAVEVARRACERTDFQDASLLDTLAAAYAETGRFDQAIETARRAIGLVKSRGRNASAEEIEKRLRVYQAGNPWRDEKN